MIKNGRLKCTFLQKEKRKFSKSIFKFHSLEKNKPFLSGNKFYIFSFSKSLFIYLAIYLFLCIYIYILYPENI